ncbi:hypothetical protein [Pseudohalioglobus lutimaris]|uniref:HPr kinase/phosphorylase C-terminal domain-containing protein n=1 Tax=Pseudohalioglobus lutimaris TaxID=1737061 RepID=A0A2N5X1P4_9GAMM|nr:hypothetical protein [Pseudohalioglobus lutimaris]PLW68406.1 hypothetical protein C0039_12780 [Pseudohalioglobus lutimaris]
MSSTWLYGIEVLSPFPLFDTPTPAAAAPGEHAAIRLQPLENTAADAGVHPIAAEEDCLHPNHADTRSSEEVRTVTSHLGQGQLGEQLSFQLTHGRQLSLYSDRPLAASAPGQPWCLEVDAVVRFHWQSGEQLIHYELLDGGNRQLLVFWFTHIFLPLHLTLERGYDFLHAAAVEMAGGPVLFLAPSTGGKSTLADHCLQRGHALFSDDKVATFREHGEYWAAPSHPHHRPWREFEVLGQPVKQFAQQANPIKAIYCLQTGEPGSPIAINEVTGFRKFEELLPNYLFNFDYLRAVRLAWLGRMAGSVPVYRLRRPWGLSQLQQTYLALHAHASGL